MKNKTVKFRDYPFTVRYGISLTIVTWIIFLVSISVETGTISVFHLSMGMFVCFAILSLRRWSRIFTSVYNLGMAFFLGRELYFLYIAGNSVFSAYIPVRILCIILFVLTAVLLLSGQSKRFFSEQG